MTGAAQEASVERTMSKLLAGVSIACTSLALLMNNPAAGTLVFKHTWTLGWIGFLCALLTFWMGPDSRARADAAKLCGFAFVGKVYVTNYGHRSLACNVLTHNICNMPIEVLAFLSFVVVFIVQWRLMLDATSNDANGYRDCEIAAQKIGSEKTGYEGLDFKERALTMICDELEAAETAINFWSDFSSPRAAASSFFRQLVVVATGVGLMRTLESQCKYCKFYATYT